ncbi:hemolysin family protein [Mycoplasma sp. ATU-Cv-508]|uniref:CNNM domain-containing protein n=1 Tax=Mycoplasma sp. ATU-Cv-508 TaxID=2048001 RepID=UPI000FDE59FF
MPWTIQLAFAIVLILLLFFSMFFSAAETAYSSVSKYTIEKNLRKNRRSARLIKKHYKSFGWTLATILLGNNLVNIAFSSISTTLITNMVTGSDMVNSSFVPIIVTAIVTPIVVLFGEIIPKLLAKRYSYGYLSKIVYLMEFFNVLLFPFTFPFSRIALSSKTSITEKEIREILSIATRQKLIKQEGALVVSRAIGLNSLRAKDIMTLRKNFVYVKVDDTLEYLLEIFRRTGHSRLPVVRGHRFVGAVMLKDILHKNLGTAYDYIQKIPNVDKNLLVGKVLEKLRINKTHMAFVTTRKTQGNAVIGLVTVEDIIEEIFGEIYDEHDNSHLINQIAPNRWKWVVI